MNSVMLMYLVLPYSDKDNEDQVTLDPLIKKRACCAIQQFLIICPFFSNFEKKFKFRKSPMMLINLSLASAFINKSTSLLSLKNRCYCLFSSCHYRTKGISICFILSCMTGLYHIWMPLYDSFKNCCPSSTISFRINRRHAVSKIGAAIVWYSVQHVDMAAVGYFSRLEILLKFSHCFK